MPVCSPLIYKREFFSLLLLYFSLRVSGSFPCLFLPGNISLYAFSLRKCCSGVVFGSEMLFTYGFRAGNNFVDFSHLHFRGLFLAYHCVAFLYVSARFLSFSGFFSPEIPGNKILKKALASGFWSFYNLCCNVFYLTYFPILIHCYPQQAQENNLLFQLQCCTLLLLENYL